MVSTKAHRNQHDNNQCKYRKDDHKNFLPILFYPFVSGFAFSALSFSSFRSLHVVKKRYLNLQYSLANTEKKSN